MYKYWYGVLKFKIETLMIVRSVRERNIMLLLSTLQKVLELCFALVIRSLQLCMVAISLCKFVLYLEVAYEDNPELFSQLSSYLSVTTTNAKFSRIAYNHKHENKNKCIKSTISIWLIRRTNRISGS